MQQWLVEATRARPPRRDGLCVCAILRCEVLARPLAQGDGDSGGGDDDNELLPPRSIGGDLEGSVPLREAVAQPRDGVNDAPWRCRVAAFPSRRGPGPGQGQRPTGRGGIVFFVKPMLPPIVQRQRRRAAAPGRRRDLWMDSWMESTSESTSSDSWMDSTFVEWLDLSTGVLHTMLFDNEYYSNHLQIAIDLNNRKQLYCQHSVSSSQPNGDVVCQGLSEQGMDALLVSARIRPRQGGMTNANQNQWHRNKFTLRGTHYKVVMPSGSCGSTPSSCELVPGGGPPAPPSPPRPPSKPPVPPASPPAPPADPHCCVGGLEQAFDFYQAMGDRYWELSKREKRCLGAAKRCYVIAAENAVQITKLF